MAIAILAVNILTIQADKYRMSKPTNTTCLLGSKQPYKGVVFLMTDMEFPNEFEFTSIRTLNYYSRLTIMGNETNGMIWEIMNGVLKKELGTGDKKFTEGDVYWWNLFYIRRRLK